MDAPVRAFLSYAHEDHAWRDALLGQLGWLIHSGDLDLFYDPQIAPGQSWNGRIRKELAAAEIVLFLVSGHFLRSGFCIKGELLPTLDRHGRDQCAVVPILCEHIDLAGTPLGPLQCLPQDPASNDLKPLKDWEGRTDLALAPVVAKLRGLMQARDARSSAAADLASPVSAPADPAGLPPRGRFVGRGTDLDQLRAWILDDSRQPIALLGPGGVGKSKLAVAALHDPAIAARFGARRLFVRLEDVRDASGIHAAVAGEFGLEPGARPAAAVAAAFRAGPALLVLDNAETPWEADLAGAEQAFAGLAELPGARLVASLRGFAPPGLADWRPILVEPLPEDAARALFTAIAGARHAGDAALPTLLVRLDGLPLAIELVAHRAATESDAATVLRLWDSERIAFPRRGQGGRKDHDLAASIALSLASPQMTVPGRRLFAILGRLPHGLARADLPALMPSEGGAAATALARTGLVPPRAERLRLLAPVREHAAEQPLDDPDAAALAAHFAALADALPYRAESAADRVAELRARAELANIEAVLPLATTPATGSALGWRWVRVGDTRLTLGSLTLAGLAYEHCNGLFSYLASCDPDNALWQRDLSVSWSKLGDVRSAQGDLPAALQAFTEGKNIADRLATADPGNALWQRDLSVSWDRIGDVRSAQGDLPAALQAFTASKNIRDRLAAADPGNAQWQRDLIVSLVKLAETATAGAAPHAAAGHYRDAVRVARDLAGSGRLAPVDGWMVEELERRLRAAEIEPKPPLD